MHQISMLLGHGAWAETEHDHFRIAR